MDLEFVVWVIFYFKGVILSGYLFLYFYQVMFGFVGVFDICDVSIVVIVENV